VSLLLFKLASKDEEVELSASVPLLFDVVILVPISPIKGIAFGVTAPSSIAWPAVVKLVETTSTVVASEELVDESLTLLVSAEGEIFKAADELSAFLVVGAVVVSLLLGVGAVVLSAVAEELSVVFLSSTATVEFLTSTMVLFSLSPAALATVELLVEAVVLTASVAFSKDKEELSTVALLLTVTVELSTDVELMSLLTAAMTAATTALEEVEVVVVTFDLIVVPSVGFTVVGVSPSTKLSFVKNNTFRNYVATELSR